MDLTFGQTAVWGDIHFTKETFVMEVFSFQTQPSKGIGKTILFPLTRARLTEVIIRLVTNEECDIKQSVSFQQIQTTFP